MEGLPCVRSALPMVTGMWLTACAWAPPADVHVAAPVGVGSAAAGARDASMPQDPNRQDPVKSRLDSLLDGEPSAGKKVFGDEEALITLHGFLNLEYVDVEGRPSTFDLHHANLFVSGRLTEELEASIEVEYEHASESIELDQAEIRFTPKRLDGLTLAAGRFYAPFGIERHDWYPTRSRLVSRPAVMRDVVPGNWYQVGVRGAYEHEFEGATMEVEAAITNGLGASANTDIRAAREFRDQNGNKAVTGRVGLALDNGLAFGISGSTMKYDGDNRLSFAGVDARYAYDDLSIVGEWVLNQVADPAATGGGFDREGFYLQASYAFWNEATSAFDVSFRYGQADTNDDVDDESDRDVYTIGCRYTHDQRLLLKLEYQLQDTRHGLADVDALRAQVVLSF